MGIRMAALLVATLLGLGSAAAGDPRVAIGMNFNFLDPDLSRIADCALRPGATTRDRGRLAHYDDPLIRRDSERDLARLVRAGVTWIRTLVWLRPGATSGNEFSMPGDLGRATRNVVALAGDLRKAGVTDWVLAFGFQGKARPSCRARGRVGACFDPASVPGTIGEVIAIRRALEGAPRPRNLWIDLENEGCPAPRALQPGPALAIPLIRSYLRAFPADRVTISCIGDHAISARFAALETIFASAGARPSFYDAHIYARGGLDPLGSAASYAEILRAAGREGIVGETNLGNEDLTAAILRTMQARGGTPAALIYWPKTGSGDQCTADLPETFAAPAPP